MPQTRTRLKKTRLKELSLVDRGGNQFADVVLMKRAAPETILSFRNALRVIRKLALRKYDPDQPRHEAGSAEGGRWSPGSGGGAGGGSGTAGAAGGSGGSGGGTRQHRTDPTSMTYSSFMSDDDRIIDQAFARWSKPSDMPLSRYADNKLHSSLFPGKAFGTRKEAWSYFQQEALAIRTRASSEYSAAKAKHTGDPHDAAVAQSRADERRSVERMLENHGLDEDGRKDRADEIVRGRTRERQSMEGKRASMIRGQLTRYSKGARGNPRSALVSPKQMIQSVLRTSKLASGPPESHNMANPNEWARDNITSALEMFGPKYPVKIKNYLRTLRDYHQSRIRAGHR